MSNTAPKLPFGITPEFLDGLNTLDTVQLKALIVTLQLQNEENEAFKETPEYIAAAEEFDMAKERFNLVAGPVKDLTKTIKNRTKVVIDRLKEKGGA